MVWIYLHCLTNNAFSPESGSISLLFLGGYERQVMITQLHKQRVIYDGENLQFKWNFRPCSAP